MQYQSTTTIRAYLARFVALGVAALLTLSLAQIANANSYTRGQHIEPAYEGWRPNEDGTFSFMFGYQNENWVEEPDVEIGPNNMFSPGEADRGQRRTSCRAVIASLLRLKCPQTGATANSFGR